MISVGSSDAREGLGSGFLGIGVGMEGNELEEGKARSCRNNGDCDSSIDPDIALSYIDKKLQNVLGHLLKDFEGGVSAENLGPKFGGYGSFLAMYQRSPVQSHPKSLQEVHDYTTMKSPRHSQLEGGRPSFLASSAAPRTDLTLKKCVKSGSGETFNPRKDIANTKCPSNLSERKPLKLRIKVGSEDPSTREKAAIYSGLGLDASPSLSMGTSSSEDKDGMYSEPQDELNGSPTKIIQAMTSFPVDGLVLLSPLSDDLINLNAKVETTKDSRKYVSVADLNYEAFRASLNGFDSRELEDNLARVNKPKIKDRQFISLSNVQEQRNVVSRKEVATDTLSCEELVSKTLRLPLLSCSSPVATATKRGCNMALKENAFGVGVKVKTVSDEETAQMGLKPASDENLMSILARNGLKDETISPLNDVLLVAREDDSGKRGKKSNSIKSVSIKKRPSDFELVDSPKKKGSWKSSGNELGNTKLKESVGQKKLKEGKTSSIPGMKRPEEESAVVLKTEKNDFLLEKASRRTEETYKDFFGGESEDEKRMISAITNSGKVENRISVNSNTSKERSISKKSDITPPCVNQPLAQTAHGTSGVTAQDNWVFCERCQQWRLLPVDMDPNCLSEKWDCSMLSWLPGMNLCTIHQDVTTKAVQAMNQASAPVGIIAQSDLSHAKPQLHSSDIQSSRLDTMPKKGIKEAKAANKEGLPIHSAFVSEPIFKHISKSDDSHAERQTLKPKEKLETMIQNLNGGDVKILELKRKRDPSQESSRPSNKLKTETSQVPIKEPVYNDQMKDLFSENGDDVETSGKNSKENIYVSLDNEHGYRDVLGKRKVKERQETGEDFQDGHRKEKKPKNESVVSEGNANSDKIQEKGCSSSKKPSIQLSVASTSNKTSKKEIKSLLQGKENGRTYDLGKNNAQCSGKSAIDQAHDKERQGDENCDRKKCRAKKSVEGSSLSSKDVKPVSINELQNYASPCETKSKDGRQKKESAGKLSRECGNVVGHQNSNAKLDGNGSRVASYGKENISTLFSAKTSQVEMVSERGKNKPFPPPVAVQVENSGVSVDLAKETNQIKRDGRQIGSQSIHSTKAAVNGCKPMQHVVSSPLKKEAMAQAATKALKEAKDLKHLADRLKNSGSNLDGTHFYFQAALKFLHAASILEISGAESSSHWEMTMSMDVYGSTAKLCEFCAHEYESTKYVAAAALAYKCMEVAYMRVLYSSHGSVNRYRQELQSSLQVVVPGESPSSSASDVGNSNHPFAADKGASTKFVESQQEIGNHVISSQNRSSLLRLLKFSRNVSLAMDASRRAQTALIAATVSMRKVQSDGKGISSMNKALNFNFQDMEEFLRLVRLAVEAINLWKE